MRLNYKLEKFFDIITEFVGFFTVALIVFMAINSNVNSGNGFLPTNVLNVLVKVREYAVLGIVALVGVQFALKRGFIIFIIYALIVAAGIILIYFPGMLPFLSPAVKSILVI